MTANSTQEAPPAAAAGPQRLFTRTFVLVWLNQFLAYVSNWLVLPVLPLYLASQGSSESYIGFVLAAFSITSFSARPFFGQWVDKGFARASLAGSSACLAIASFAYLIANPMVLFAARGLHGFGWAGINAVGSGWSALLAPARRRAEALAYYTIAQAATLAFGPVLGLAIAAQWGEPMAFTLAGVIALASMATIFGARQSETAPPPVSSTPTSRWSILIERSAVSATLLLGLINLVAPASSAYIPLFFVTSGIDHPELYFLAQGITGIAARPFAGKWSDRLGRIRMLAAGFLIQLVGFVMLATGTSLPTLVAAGIVITLGNAIREPAFYAMVIDRAAPDRRGAALATYTMGYQIGSGLGSALWGFVIQYLGYRSMYFGCVVPLALGLVMLLWFRSPGKRETQSEKTRGRD